MISYGSLFSGACDGLSLGFERACDERRIAYDLAYQVEIDDWCRTNLERLWPGVDRYADIRGLSVPAVDVLVGGFPCQDLSLAGNGEGLSGSRSGLWFEYLRIIQETKPKGVLIENVPGLLRRGLDVVIEGLTDAGYAVEATRIKARDIGAPHKRERVFIVAYSDCRGCEGQRINGLLDGVGQAFGNDADRRYGAFGMAYTVGDELRHQQGGSGGSSGGGTSIPGNACATGTGNAQPELGGGAYGLPRWVDRFPTYRGEVQHAWEPPRVIPKAKYPARRARLKALGNSVVPHCAYIAACKLLDELHQRRLCS